MSRARDLANGTFNKSQDAETNIELTNTNAGSSAQVRTKYTTDGGLFTVGKTSDAHVYGGDAYVYNVDNTNIRFATGDTERLRILSSGGITFNGDTAAANALDDYEEGTWTPSDASGASLTLNTANGTYIKIGNCVWLWYQIQYPSNSDPNPSHIQGIPFNPTNNQTYSGTISITNYGSSNILGMFEPSSGGFKFRNYSNASITNASLSTFFFYGTAFYISA